MTATAAFFFRRCAVRLPPLLLALLLKVVLMPGVATGADAPVEEIQVTATRRPVAAGEVSSAVTLIDADTVRSLKLTTDSLANQPGVFLQQTTPGQGAAIVRGLKGSEVLHLVDGFRLNNAIFRNAPTQYLALVSPSSVERVEVLRGSPASLYGSDAVGGIVQVVNRMPTVSQTGFAHRGELGVSVDSAEQERGLRALFDVGGERLAGLLSVDTLETGNRKVGGGERIGPSGYSAESLRAALTYEPQENQTWLLDVQYGRQPKTPRVDELVAGFGETEPASEEFFFAPNERRFLHLRHTRADGWFGADWAVDAGWQRIVDDRITRNFGSSVRRIEDNASDLFGLLVTANGAWGRGSWIAGAELYHDEVSSRRLEVDVATGSRSEVRARFADGSEVQQLALFAQFGMPVSDRQELSAGARFSLIDVSLAETAFAPGAKTDFDDISLDAGWSYDVGESVQLVANASYGFRAPNIFDLGALGERPGNRFNVPNDGLTSERVTQLDVGLRTDGESLDMEVVVWRLDYRDRITSIATGEQTADGRDIVRTENAASAKLWGLEAVARYSFSERAVAELVLNMTRGEQSEIDGRTVPADRVPPVNGRLSMTFDVGERFSWRPSVAFAGEQNRLSVRDVNDPRIDPAGTRGWVTANVDVFWQPDDRWRLSVSALNLFDERYRVHGSGLDAPGRNLRAALSYGW